MKLALRADSTAIPPRLGVLFPGALGDFICLLPALHFLARTAQLDVFARSEYAVLAPETIKVQSIERYEISRLFVEGGGAEDRVRDFFSSYLTVYSWAGSGQAVFRDQLSQVAECRVFPFRPAGRWQHQMDYYYSCVAADAVALLPEIPLLPSALTWWQSYAVEQALVDQPLLVLAPGSGALEKNWPARSFAEIANWWRQSKGGRVLILFGPVEAERNNPNEWAGELILHTPTLAQAAALLSRCQLYLGNDSGITHLAAAVGAPTVALFGPTDAAQWAPRGNAVSVLSLAVECAPCAVPAMKICQHRKCLTALSPDQVVAHIEQLGCRFANLTR